LISIHVVIVQEKRTKVKGPKTLLAISNCGYATEEAMAGVPQLASVRKVELGGRYVNNVVGAVAEPIDVAGLDTAVPPVMLELTPAPLDPSSTQVVTKVNTVLPALRATVVLINSGVYGDVALFNWNNVTAAAPAVKL
jgi:hypothetical protein